MKQIGYVVLIWALVSISIAGISKTTTAITDGGNWIDPGTWNNGVPADGDVINIPLGIAVVVNSNIFSPVNLRGPGTTTINVSGEISFELLGMIRLDLGDGDAVNVLSGGALTGDIAGGAIAFGTNFFSGYSPFVYVSGIFPVDGPAVISDGVLPIELVSFDAKLVNDHVELLWATASELNNDYFNVERAADIEQFETVGVAINGHGTTNEAHNYSAIDEAPFYGRSFYRLRQTDLDGTVSYSDVVVIDNEGPRFAALKLYPNPTRGRRLSLRVVGLREQRDIPVQIFDAKGQAVYYKVLTTTTPGTLQQEIDFVNPLKPGLYVVRAGKTLQMTQKLLVQ